MFKLISQGDLIENYNHLNNLNKDIGKIQSAFGLYGNGLNNNGTHLIDWSRMFLGEVNWVQAIANGECLKEGPIRMI